jgi:group I intron endonuclease
MYYLYKLTNEINGKTYIGQTINPEQRWSNNGYQYRESKILFNAIKKYGFQNFKKEILCEYETQEEINNAEIQTISEYKQQGKAEYNIAGGGHCNTFKYMSKEEILQVREKMSESHKGLQCGKNHPMYGKHHTEEAIKKIKENRPDTSGKNHPMYGKHHTEESKILISQNSARLSGKEHPMYGKKHTEESRTKMSESHKGKIPVNAKKIKYLKTGQVFNSISEAVKILHVGKQTIYNELQVNYTFVS